MSDTDSSESQAVGATQPDRTRTLGPNLVAVGIVFALAVAVAALRFYRLDTLPAGIQVSEALNGIDALRVLRGEHAVFFPSEFSGHEGLVVYLIALSIALLDQTDLALRLPTTMANAATVFVVFWLGRLFFGKDEEGRVTRWRGILIGGVAAGLMAVSIGQTVLGRTVFRANLLLLILALCLGLMWWGWRERSWWGIGLAGVCAGLLQYTYIPARFTPFLFLFIGLSFMLPFLGGSWNRTRAELPRAAFFGIVALITALPILVYFFLHPEHFFLRSDSLLVFRPDINNGDLLGTLRKSVVQHVGAFGWRGDWSWRHNFNAQPMLNPWEATFFWAGTIIAIWRWQRPAYRLLILWLGFLLLPAALAIDYAPNTLRMLGATPPVYLLTAVGLWETFRLVTNRYTAKRTALAAIALGVALGSAILVQGINTFQNYFGKWSQEPLVKFAYEAPWSDFARTLDAQPSTPNTIYLIPSSLDHPSFDYIYTGVASVFYYPRETFDLVFLAKEVESALRQMPGPSIVKVVLLSNKHVGWIGNDTGRVSVLLHKYGRYVGTEYFDDFRIHSFTDVALDRAWTFYDYMEPMTVEYDGGISLQGTALGQGEEQISFQQPRSLEPAVPLWMAFRWQVKPELATDFSVSVRFYNAEGEVVLQQDSVLWNPLHEPTSQWDSEKEVETLLQLDLPPDLPPDLYQPALVVYDLESLTPTVQIGIWEPELLLPKLRLAE